MSAPRPELAQPGGPSVREPERVVDSPFRVGREPVPTLVIDYGETRTYVMDRSGGTHRIDPRCARKPTVVEPDCVVIKVQLRVPGAAFEPLQPEAVVTVPESLVQHPVDVEAVDADD